MYKATSIIHGNVVTTNEEIEIFSPLNNECIGSIPCLGDEKIAEAFSSATLAFETWKKTDAKLRQRFMFAFAERLRQQTIFLTELLHKETGKSLNAAADEINRSIEYIIETIHAYDEMVEKPEEYNHDNNVLMPKNLVATFLRVPCGIALTISPFNYPVNLMLTKIVPAILMGNCVVHKSSTQGSLCGWYISKIFNETTIDQNFQVYPGVLNFITGKGSVISKALTFGNIDVLSFTGSTEIGYELSSKLPNVSKQLEMGGLNVAIILKDSDLEAACNEVIAGAFNFSGQRCTAIKKVLIEKSVYEQALELIKAKALSLSESFDPVINQNSFNKVKEFYKDAQMHGAKLLTPEIDWSQLKGLYIPPIVFSGINNQMKIFKEELFGPILGITSFEELEDAIDVANGTEYGLQASIFTSSLELATAMVHELDFGRININKCPARSPDILPFAGVKKSGLGGEQGIKNSLYFFSKFKGVVCKKEAEITN